MSYSLKSAIAILAVIQTTLPLESSFAFTQTKSSFAGRASSVCDRSELTTGYSCVTYGSSNNTRSRNALSMPPFLKKLGLKKPGGDNDKNKEDEDESSSNQKVAILSEPEKTTSTDGYLASLNAKSEVEEECVLPAEEKELSETEKLLKQVKEAGTAGVISYALWELGFWALSVPVCIFGYYQVTGHFPDLSQNEDRAKLGAEAFAFVNFARFAVPLRIGLALSTTPWIQENVVDKFMKKEDENVCEEE